MTIKELKEKYSVFNITGNQYEIYDKTEYCGYLTKEKTRWFFHGLPIDEVVHVKTLSDVEKSIEHFRTRCDDEWVVPIAVSPLLNKSCINEYVLSFVANKFGWKTLKDYSSTYVVGSSAFGTKVFEISVSYKENTSCFLVSFNGGYYSESPEFTDYFESLNWLKNLISSTFTSVGVEYISTIINNDMQIKNMDEIAMSKINFSNLSVEHMSFNDYIIALLEKQIESLKKIKNI